jgi:hypothetical protein
MPPRSASQVREAKDEKMVVSSGPLLERGRIPFPHRLIPETHDQVWPHPGKWLYLTTKIQYAARKDLREHRVRYTEPVHRFPAKGNVHPSLEIFYI